MKSNAATKLIAARKPRERNKRVRVIDKRAWRFKRLQRFQHSTRFAADAKSVRTGLGITQRELAKSLGISAQAVCERESGFYSWLSEDAEKELSHWKRVCARLAGIG